MKLFVKGAVTIAAAIMLTACGDDSGKDADKAAMPVATAADIARAETLLPEDPALSAIYERSCNACHSQIDAIAPLTGHKAAWQALITAKGKDGLLQSAKNGFNNMPAMGYCSDCSDSDLTALINFMSGEGQ